MLVGLLLCFYFLVFEAKTVCFHISEANARGTTISMYDFADFTEILLHHKSVIILPWLNVTHGLTTALGLFQTRFQVEFYYPNPPTHTKLSGGSNLPILGLRLGCDIMYTVKSGLMRDAPIFPHSFDCRLPVAVHAIFTYEKHGTTYAALNKIMTNGEPIVPNIVRWPMNVSGNLRSELNISSSDFVVCRHGGRDTFNVPFVHQAIYDMLGMKPEKRTDWRRLRFLFLGTDKIRPAVHAVSDTLELDKRITYLPTTINSTLKELFVASCDVMLHARRDGETFGNAIAEFSMRNKPIVTYSRAHPASCEHLRILGKLAYLYASKDSLVEIFAAFLRDGVPARDFNAYRQYAPEVVMQQFDEVFLKPVFDSNSNTTVKPGSNRCNEAAPQSPEKKTSHVQSLSQLPKRAVPPSRQQHRLQQQSRSYQRRERGGGGHVSS